MFVRSTTSAPCGSECCDKPKDESSILSSITAILPSVSVSLSLSV